jgi:hypothetical protein
MAKLMVTGNAVHFGFAIFGVNKLPEDGTFVPGTCKGWYII